MADYTKFRLKPAAEITAALAGVPRLAVLWCAKCNKDFTVERESDPAAVRELLGADAGKLAWETEINFLCNEHFTAQRLSAPELDGIPCVGVVSCGLGIQLAARLLPGRRVFALADSIPEGSHGLALGTAKCAACAQCYLSLTGGICPVVNCAKSLLNGPCGGAKNGKCEVGTGAACVWEDIFLRLQGQGRGFSPTVEVRNFQKYSFAAERQDAAAARLERTEGFFGGIHPAERKAETEHRAIEPFPAPGRVAVFLSQHTGIPARPLVQAGDAVKIGRKIGQSGGFISASVHASVSGQVVGIEQIIHPVSQQPSPAVVIENDSRDAWDESVVPLAGWETAGPGELRAAIEDKGIVGLGGAMFPLPAKLKPPKPVDCLLVNGCECEPFLNADNRLLLERAEEILDGVRIIGKILGVSRIIIGVEENKPEAVSRLAPLTAGSELLLTVLPTKYPQGAERMLVKRVLGRTVPEGGLPLDVGVVVTNVGTAYAAWQAVALGRPLIERVVTVTGDGVRRPGNFLMRIGTPLADVLRECAVDAETDWPARWCVRMGGPMMGVVQTSAGTAVVKGTGGLTILPLHPVAASSERDCIKCGRCVEVCPVELSPFLYAYYGKRDRWEDCLQNRARACIECGSCDYICSSKISLVGLIKKAKRYAHNKT